MAPASETVSCIDLPSANQGPSTTPDSSNQSSRFAGIMRCKYSGLQLKLVRPKNEQGEPIAGPSGSQIQDANTVEDDSTSSVAEVVESETKDDNLE